MENAYNGERSKMLAGEGIGKLLLKLSTPTILAMLVQALYNVVDTIFVGQGVGTLAIGGMAVAFPIQMSVMAISQTIGIGGASIISRRMGAGDKSGVGLTFGNMILIAEIIGIIFLLLSRFAVKPLVSVFGATPDIMPYSIDYLSIVLLGGPLMTFSSVSNDAVRAEGNAKIAMISMVLGSVLNMILDPIFIFILNMGIKGAAAATVISYGATALLFLVYFFSGKSEIPMGFSYFRIRIKIIEEMLAVGSASLVMAGSMSFTMAIIMNTLKGLGTGVEIAVFGIIHRVFSFIFMPVMGISQGMQPIVGFNYGAKQMPRVKRTIKITALSATTYTTLGFIVIMSFPASIFRLFVDDQALIKIGVEALRYSVITLPIIGFQGMSSGLFQALGKPLPALLMSLSRQVLVMIPSMLILPRIIGIIGVWLSFPVSDLLSFGFALALVLKVVRGLSEKDVVRV